MDHTSHTFLPENMPFNPPGLTEEFDLCCADSVVNVLGYVLLLYGTFKELSPLWGVFEKQSNFCHTAKHVSDFLNILTRMTQSQISVMVTSMKIPGM